MPAQTHPVRLEHALLGICLLEPAVFQQASRLTPTDFSDPRHALVFRVGLDLATRGKPSGAIDVMLELSRLDLIAQAGGQDYLFDLIADPVAWDVRLADDLIASVAEWSARRSASGAAQNHALAFLNSRIPIDRAIDEVRSTVARVTEALIGDEFEPLGAISGSLIEGWLNPDMNPGLPTGIAQLDEQINGGLRPGQLIVIAGDTGSGKSSLASQIALAAAHAAKANPGRFGAPQDKVAPVLYFSFEMSKEEIYERQVAQVSPVSDTFRTPRGWLPTDLPLAIAGARMIASLPLVVFDENRATIEAVRSTVERFCAVHGGKPALVVVDYIGLMNMPGTTNRVEVISHITRSLKAMAREIRVPIIVLAQFNREAGKRRVHRPGLTDLRESGSIEQDANIVLLIYRQSYYTVDPEAKRAAEDDNPEVEVIVAKNRSGRRGTIRMTWLGRRFLFVPDPTWASAFDPSAAGDPGIIEFPNLTRPSTSRSTTIGERVIEVIGTHCDTTHTRCERGILLDAFGTSRSTKWLGSSVGQEVERLVKAGRVVQSLDGRTVTYSLPAQRREPGNAIADRPSDPTVEAA